MEIKRSINRKGQITGFKFLVGFLIVTFIFMGLLTFHTSISDRFGVEIDPQYQETYGLINDTLGETRTLTASLEEKAQAGGDVGTEVVELTGPKSSFEAGVVFLRSPRLTISIVQDVLGRIGFPYWFILGTATLIIIIGVFIVLAFARGRKL